MILHMQCRVSIVRKAGRSHFAYIWSSCFAVRLGSWLTSSCHNGQKYLAPKLMCEGLIQVSKGIFTVLHQHFVDVKKHPLRPDVWLERIYKILLTSVEIYQLTTNKPVLPTELIIYHTIFHIPSNNFPLEPIIFCHHLHFKADVLF